MIDIWINFYVNNIPCSPYVLNCISYKQDNTMVVSSGQLYSHQDIMIFLQMYHWLDDFKDNSYYY